MRLVRMGIAVGLAAASFAAGLRLVEADGSAPAPIAQDAGTTDAGAACVKWWGEARSTGTGYRHVVLLSNGCTKPAVCDVSTDVNPEVQKVTVTPATIEEVVTFFDSPAYAFTPNVTCKLK